MMALQSWQSQDAEKDPTQAGLQEKVASLPKLADALEEMTADPQFAFHWVDLLLGAVLDSAPADASPEEVKLQDEEVVSGLLMPFLPWVVGDSE